MSTLKTINVVHPSGAVNNIVNDNKGNIDIGGTVAMSSSFKRNRIINGNMAIWQRGTSFTGLSSTKQGYLAADRFHFNCGSSGTGVFSVTRSTDTPPGIGFPNSIRVQPTTAMFSVAPSSYTSIAYNVESYNVADLCYGTPYAKPLVLSFWVKSNVTGIIPGGIGQNAAISLGRTFPFTYTIAAANVWQKITVLIPGDTSGGVNINQSGIGLHINFFYLNIGSSYQNGTENVWNTGTSPLNTNFIASGRTYTNMSASTSNYMQITGVQLEVGTKATPYEFQIYSEQLMQCQRYFWKTYNQEVAPGSGHSGPITYSTYRTRSYVGSYGAAVVQFPVLMRIAPNVTLYNGLTGALNSWYCSDNDLSVTASVGLVQDSAVTTESNNMVPNLTYFFHLLADAEL